MSRLAWLIVTAVAGLGLGAGLGASGAISLMDDSVRYLAADEVTFYDCPDGNPLGSLTRGDLVLLTGEDETGTWVQLRSPIDVSDRVWVRQSVTVTVDSPGTVAEWDLPVRDCPTGEPPTVTPPDTTPTSSTTTTSTTSTTTTSTTSTTTTTSPTDNSGPTISNLAWLPDEIQETPESGQPACPGLTIVLISVQADDPAGVTGVTLTYQIGSLSDTVTMDPSGPGYSAQLGPFDHTTIDGFGNSEAIRLTIRATDGLDNARVLVEDDGPVLNNCGTS